MSVTVTKTAQTQTKVRGDGPVWAVVVRDRDRPSVLMIRDHNAIIAVTETNAAVLREALRIMDEEAA